MRLLSSACVLLAGVGLTQQSPPARQDPPIRVGVELITTNVVVRDRNGRFVPDLSKDDFELIEEGRTQKIVSFVLSLGGRIFNVTAPPLVPSPEGMVLPARRPLTRRYAFPPRFLMARFDKRPWRQGREGQRSFGVVII